MEARNPRIYLDKLDESTTLKDDVVVLPVKVIITRFGIVIDDVNENVIVTPETIPIHAVVKS